MQSTAPVKGSPTTVYYSEVFAGDRQKIGSAILAFNAYVQANYDNVGAGSLPSCFNDTDQSSARSNRDSRTTEARNVYKYAVIQTNWTY